MTKKEADITTGKTLIFFIVFSFSPLFAQWGPQGVVVCDTSANTNSMLPEIAPDDEGGAHIAWTDVRNGYYDIYAQRLDSAGIPQWQHNGIPIARNNTSQQYQKIISDGKGGAYIAWEDNRGDNTYIWAQRINKAGEIFWQENGVKVAETGGLFIALSLDEEYGLLLGWKSWINDDGTTIVQHLDSLGNRLWPDSGIQVTTRPGTIGANDVSIASDGANGGIVTWSEGTNNDSMRVYVQRIDSVGIIQWVENGICLSDTNSSAIEPAIRSDREKGAFVGWVYSDGNLDNCGNIQRVNYSGEFQWSNNGILIENDGGVGAGIERFTPDMNNGIFFGKGYKIFHIDSSGNYIWPDGVTFGFGMGTYSSQAIDGLGGVFNFWQSWEDGVGYSTKVQWIDSSGIAHHGENGVNVIDPLEINFQQRPRACSDTNNGAIVCFTSPSPLGHHIVYANRVDTSSHQVGIHDQGFIINKLELKQNYPNPFNPETVIRYRLSVSSEVELSIYNVMGQKIITLVNQRQKAGEYTVQFSGNNLPSGVYFYRLQTKQQSITRKMLLVR